MMKRNTLLLGAGWLAMVALAAAFLIAPAWRADRELKAEIASLRIEAKDGTDSPEIIETLSARLESLETFGEGRMTPIPRQSNIAGLMHDLSTILTESGLHDREVKMGAAVEAERASSIPMTVTVNGDFTRVLDALRRIEAMDRLIRVRRLRIGNDNARSRELDRTGQVSAVLTMDVFYAPDDAAPEGEG